MKTELRLPAIEVRQSLKRTLYTFAVDAKLVPSFATVSRIRRKESYELQGYQRPEVLAHIEEIRAYVESESPMIPNAVVLAFDSRVHFEPQPGTSSAYAHPGTLCIPVDDEAPEEERPGFIVDGQQRLAAIRDASVDSFPICVSAFITSLAVGSNRMPRTSQTGPSVFLFSSTESPPFLAGLIIYLVFSMLMTGPQLGKL